MFSRIYFRIFCYPTEDENKVKDALLFVAFGEMDPSYQQNIQHKVSSDKHKFPLVFEVILEKNRDIKKFSERIQQISLPYGLEERIDDNCYLFLRFSKQEASQKKLVVIEQGDTIFLKAKIRVFPSKRQEAIRILREDFLNIKK